MNIIQSVESGSSWRDIIYSIIGQEDFDPWDIDVAALTDSYLQKVKEMKMVNFRIPGTVILVGAVLVKFKSDVVSNTTSFFQSSLDSLEGETGDMTMDLPGIDIDPDQGGNGSELDGAQALYIRRVPKRKVTLPELMIFLKRVVNQVEKKTAERERTRGREIAVKLKKKDLEKIMRQVFTEIKSLAKKDKTTFRDLVTDWNKEAIVDYLVPILHLANKDKVMLQQKKIYGDIFISPK